MSLAEELILAEHAAREAGALLLANMLSAQTVLCEMERDIKLQADRDAEALILSRLASTGYPVLAEESGAHGAPGGDSLYWVVDPLDGTFNYSRQLPVCGVSIGLCRGDEPVLGVIYDFTRDEIFSGIVGEGAWLNGKPMCVSQRTERKQAVLCTGTPARGDFSPEVLRDYITTLVGFKKVRLLGSAAVMLAYVACGRTDAYLENDIMWWDVAAGLAIVRAAGGWAECTESPRIEWGRRVKAAGRAEIWA